MRKHKPLPTELQELKIEKLVHGGQALAELADGRKVFVWNALPGETVEARIIKDKKSYCEAIAEEIMVASPDRIEPTETNYLSSAPWDIMEFAKENEYKREIVQELFSHETIELPEPVALVVHDDFFIKYRNKMEYSFWGDDAGLHLALHQRGSHGKHIMEPPSQLCSAAVNMAAFAVLDQLNQLNVRGSDLKTIIVRYCQDGPAVAALFVKREDFHKLSLPPGILQGLRVYYSNPNSPASVPTKLLQELGEPILQDKLLDQTFVYDVDSFFQVNVPVFELALKHVKSHITEPAITDMYAGVGSIGLSVASKQVDLIELDPATAHMASENASRSSLDVNVIQTSAETALEYITGDKPVIFDPPRAGLHDKVVDRVLEVLPPKIVYLSCNPATHARDLAKLQEAYKIIDFQVYNFFPRTPHIETLAVLERS